MKKLSVIFAATCAALVFSANGLATNFSYSNIDLQAERFYLKDSVSQDGGSIASLKLGYQFHPNLFTRFTLKRYVYESNTASELSLLQVGLGLGAAVAISATTDLYALAEAGEVNLNDCSSVGLTTCHGSYVMGEVGLRHWASSSIELNIAHRYYDEIKLYKKANLASSSYEVPVGISFWLDPRAALKLGYTYDQSSHSASLGYEFRF